MRRPASEGGGGGGGNTTPCCTKVGIKRGPWTAEEDEVLANFVRKEGEGKWRTLPKRAGLLRCGKSCRLRWMNYLRPSVKRGHIAPDEEDLILRLHRLLGNRWSLIAGRIPGRTDNEIKNYWNTHLSKKLVNQGIDPRTHKPFKPDHKDKPSSSSSSKTARQQDQDRRNNNPNKNHGHQYHVGNKPLLSTTEEDRRDYHKSPGGSQPNDLVNHHHHQHQNMVSATTGKAVPNLHGYESFSNYSQGISENNNIIAEQTNLVVGNNEDHDDLNYCSDDMFSSFLNSLINEDAFLAPPPHQHQPVSLPSIHHIAPFPSTTADPFLPPNTAAPNAWETAIISSSFHQINDPQRDVDDPMD